MTILVVDPLGIGPLYDQYFCTSLAESGAEVTLAIREPEFLPGYFDNRKFRVKRLTRISKVVLPGDSLVAKFFKYAELLLLDYPRIVVAALRSSIVHVQWLSPRPVADVELWYWRIVQLLGKKIVFTAHNVFPLGGNHAATPHLSRIYGFFDRIVVTCDYGKKLIDRHFPECSSKTVNILHGPFFHDAERVPAVRARAQLGLPPSRPIVFFQGFFSPHKGVEFLLEAFPRVVAKHRDALLLLVGGGDPVYRSKISALLRTCAIPPENMSARFELIPLRDLALYFCAADIVVLPYKDIYQSGALFTALAFGKAVVATRVGGLPEVVQDRVNGCLVEYGDTQGLATTISELVASPNDRRKLGEKGYATATEQCGWKMIAEKSEVMYRHAIDSR